MDNRSTARKGFTLVELLVVIGIIALLIGILMPAVQNVKGHANSAKCKAQMRSIGQLLLLYSQEYPDFYYPVGEYRDTPAPGYFDTLGCEARWAMLPDQGRQFRWPVYVMPSKLWNDPALICPSDYEPAEEHTYILNKHLSTRRDKRLKPGMSVPGRSTSEIILMGEKKTLVQDYYMGSKEEQGDQSSSEFAIVEMYRHGLKLGSNYLYLDYHVELMSGKEYENTIDPWDVDINPGSTTKPTTP